ncbi:unnamed protein product [Fusarium graminearum]|uniref:Uncharacterized protein n=1 Tax=Gibberella zeae TaxID=5518 RepID=A0A9N8RLX8_GIBZA|nr:unnamed protein product [Fusarium graminearum]
MILSFIQKVAGPCFHQNIMRLVRVWVLKARIANGSPFLPTQDIQGFISDAETTLPESQILEQLNTNDTPNSDNLNATIDLVKIPEGLEWDSTPATSALEQMVLRETLLAEAKIRSRN